MQQKQSTKQGSVWLRHGWQFAALVWLPFCLGSLWLSWQPGPDLSGEGMVQTANLAETLAAAETALADLTESRAALAEAVSESTAAAQKQAAEIQTLTKTSQEQKEYAKIAYETMIVNRLGRATMEQKGSRSEIMIFPLEKADYRGYMAKIKLKTKDALAVTVAPADQPQGETTLEAVQRLGGILGVNGGGFASQTKDGVARLVPMGNTMVAGELVGGFQPAANDFAFAGFDQKNRLVGGSYQTETALRQSGAWQGVSFVPALIRDWEKTEIPAKWQNARQPRTVLGQYPNGDVFFLVVDGRQSDWSNGITLEELQDFLLELGVMEAFNLDGGGSSTFVYDGTVKNKPSDGSPRRLATNLVVRL